MKRLLPFVVAGIILVAGAAAIFWFARPHRAVVIFWNGTTVTAEVAASLADQQRGLSGRDSLAADAGMLFPINPPAVQTFWMHQMKFPIDIIWIKDGRVIGFQLNVPVSTGEDPEPLYRSPGAVDDVLEVNAGFIAKNGIQVSMPVQIPQNP